MIDKNLKGGEESTFIFLTDHLLLSRDSVNKKDEVDFRLRYELYGYDKIIYENIFTQLCPVLKSYENWLLFTHFDSVHRNKTEKVFSLKGCEMNENPLLQFHQWMKNTVQLEDSWQLTDGCSTRWLSTIWRLPDACLMTSYQMPKEWVPDNCLMTTWLMPADCLTTAWKLPNNCLMATWQIPADCPMITWKLPLTAEWRLFDYFLSYKTDQMKSVEAPRHRLGRRSLKIKNSVLPTIMYLFPPGSGRKR